jgi:hypothetical protein
MWCLCMSFRGTGPLKSTPLSLEEFMTVAGGSPGTGAFQANVASLRGEVMDAELKIQERNRIY